MSSSFALNRGAPDVFDTRYQSLESTERLEYRYIAQGVTNRHNVIHDGYYNGRQHSDNNRYLNDGDIYGTTHSRHNNNGYDINITNAIPVKSSLAHINESGYSRSSHFNQQEELGHNEYYERCAEVRQAMPVEYSMSCGQPGNMSMVPVHMGGCRTPAGQGQGTEALSLRVYSDPPSSLSFPHDSTDGSPVGSISSITAAASPVHSAKTRGNVQSSNAQVIYPWMKMISYSSQGKN